MYPLRCSLPSGTQLGPTPVMTLLPICGGWDICLEVPWIMVAMDTLNQLAHLPPYANARLAFLWGVN